MEAKMASISSRVKYSRTRVLARFSGIASTRVAMPTLTGSEIQMFDKNHAAASSAGDVPSQQTLPQALDESDQQRVATGPRPIENYEFIDSEELARRSHSTAHEP